MRRRLRTTTLTLVCLPTLAMAPRFSQIVLPFPERVRFDHHFAAETNELVLDFPATSPDHLEAANYYDERVVRRLLVRDKGVGGSQLRLTLRDTRLRAVVSTKNEPFRVIIDIFDPEYQIGRDPLTQRPTQTAPETRQLVSELAPDGRAPRRSNAASDTFAGSTGAERTANADDLLPPPMIPSTDGGGVQLLRPRDAGDPYRPNPLQAEVADTPLGRGDAWESFPVYIYRLTTAALDAQESQQQRPNDPRLPQLDATARYAASLFDAGNERQAAVAYQALLKENQAYLAQHPKHLWKFAEAHFGSGNLALAGGYFRMLRERHPQHALAPAAGLRIAQIRALNHMDRGRFGALPELVKALPSPSGGRDPEMFAQTLIHRTYWNQPGRSSRDHRERLPAPSPSVAKQLAEVYPRVEHPRTSFLTASLLLKSYLQPEMRWFPSTAEFAAKYFRRFRGPRAEPFRGELATAFAERVRAVIAKHGEKREYLEAVKVFESLPEDQREVAAHPDTAWTIGNAYRLLGQYRKAVPHLEIAARELDDPGRQTTATYWLAVSAARVTEGAPAARAAGGPRGRYADIAQAADRRLYEQWQDLPESARRKLFSALRPELEAAVTAPYLLSSPPRILLDTWSEELASEAGAAADPSTDEWSQLFSPSAATINLLNNIATRFDQLGRPQDKRRTIELLRQVPPSRTGADKEAQQVWTDQMTALAADLRRAGDYLAAGRLYTLIGDESQDWDGRAGSLYRGGLMLYQAGRRDEAIEAFTKASQDPNNPFYAEAAKERLYQLEQR